MGRYFAIRRYPLLEGRWDTLRAPIDCSFITIENAGVVALRLRETESDAATEKRIPAGGEFGIQSPVATFGVDDPIVCMTSASDATVAVVTFTR